MQVVRNDEIPVEAIDGIAPDKIVLSPGPCTPTEAGISIPTLLRFAGQIPILGVCLGHQSIGQAFGGRIIRAQTAMADAEGLPCWLETATPENVPLYERLGFVTQVEWDVPGGGPHFWGMRVNFWRSMSERWRSSRVRVNA